MQVDVPGQLLLGGARYGEVGRALAFMAALHGTGKGSLRRCMRKSCSTGASGFLKDMCRTSIGAWLGSVLLATLPITPQESPHVCPQQFWPRSVLAGAIWVTLSSLHRWKKKVIARMGGSGCGHERNCKCRAAYKSGAERGEQAR